MISQDIRALLTVLNEISKCADELVPELQELGSTFMPILENLTDAVVDQQLRAFFRFKKAGLCDDYALLLTMNTKFAVEQLGKKA